MTQITDDGAQAFTPYTAEEVDPMVDQAIAHLEAKIKQLMSLKGAGDRYRRWEDKRSLW
jgi:hypothetical protein